MTWRGAAWYGVAWRGRSGQGAVWQGVLWRGVTWRGITWPRSVMPSPPSAACAAWRGRKDRRGAGQEGGELSFVLGH